MICSKKKQLRLETSLSAIGRHGPPPGARTDLPGHKPWVSVETNHLAKIIFSVTLFCPTGEAMALEDVIAEAVLTHAYSTALKTPEEA